MPVDVSDPRELLLGYLDWYRDTVVRNVPGYPPGGVDAEWTVAADVPAQEVLAAWAEEVARGQAAIARAALDAPSAVGGRFPSAEQAPPLGRILFHLLQEYARHVGHLDIVRQLLDGGTGE